MVFKLFCLALVACTLVQAAPRGRSNASNGQEESVADVITNTQKQFIADINAILDIKRAAAKQFLKAPTPKPIDPKSVLLLTKEEIEKQSQGSPETDLVLLSR